MPNVFPIWMNSENYKYTHCDYEYGSTYAGWKFAYRTSTGTGSSTKIRYGGNYTNAFFAADLKRLKDVLKNAVITGAQFVFGHHSPFADYGNVSLYTNGLHNEAYSKAIETGSEQWRFTFLKNRTFTSDMLLGESQSIPAEETSPQDMTYICVYDTNKCELLRQRIINEDYIFVVKGSNSSSASEPIVNIGIYVTWKYKNPEVIYNDLYTTENGDFNKQMNFYFCNRFFYDNNTMQHYYEYNYESGIGSDAPIIYRAKRVDNTSTFIWEKKEISDNDDTWTQIEVTNPEENKYVYVEEDYADELTNDLFTTLPTETRTTYNSTIALKTYDSDHSETTSKTFNTLTYPINVELNGSVVPFINITSRSAYAFDGVEYSPVDYITNWTGDLFHFIAAGAYGSVIQKINLTYDNHSEITSTKIVGREPVFNISAPYPYPYSDTASATLIVTDSRGRTASTTDILSDDDAYKPYEYPKFNSNPAVYRSTVSGEKTDSGQYVAVDFNVYSMDGIRFAVDSDITENYPIIDFEIKDGLTTVATKTITDSYSGTAIIGRTEFNGIPEYASGETYEAGDECYYSNGSETHRYIALDEIFEAPEEFDENQWKQEDFVPSKVYTISCRLKDLGYEKLKKSTIEYSETFDLNVPTAEYVIHINPDGTAIGIGGIAGEDRTVTSRWKLRTANNNGVKSEMDGGAFSFGNGVAAGKSFVLTLSDWSINVCTCTVNGLLADADLIISPAVSSFRDYIQYGIYCSNQNAGQIVFTCTEIPPAGTNITVNVLALGGIPVLA